MPTPPVTRTGSRRMRVDASRNRERLLASATAAFAEHGADVSLDEIADRAGVSIATLYRHFPSRESLLEETLRDQLEALGTKARDLLSSPSPGDALETWLRAMLDQAVAYRGLPGPLKVILESESSDLSSVCVRVNAPAAELLVRAQQAGAVRTDIEFRDLIDLVSGIAWAADQTLAPDRAQRLLSLVICALRCDADGGSTRAAAGKPEPSHR
jgi:AcrR family transcriptional regulator